MSWCIAYWKWGFSRDRYVSLPKTKVNESPKIAFQSSLIASIGGKLSDAKNIHYTSLIENISIARLQDVLRIISYNVQTMFRKWNDLTAEYTCCRTISCKTSHMFSLISLSHLTVWFEMCFSKPTKNMCQNALLKLLVKIPRQLNHIFFAIWAWHHDSYMTGTFVASIVSIPS